MYNWVLNRSACYYCSLLAASEKAVYNTLLQAILDVSPKVSLPLGATRETVAKVMQYISNDRPDIFWRAGGYTISTSNDVVKSVSFEYRMSKSEAEVIKYKLINSVFYRQLDSLISSKRTAFEKALAAYEYIIKRTEYDLRAAESDSDYYEYAYNVDGVMLNSRAVCAGYAKTFQYFMNKHGIFCTLATGRTSRGRHAWNLINLDGSYYYIDTTWGDPVFKDGSAKDADYVSYDYFCITTDELNKSHRAILDCKMPLCYDTRYNYYKYFNMISDAFSAADIVSRMISAYRNGQNEAVIRYSSQSAYLTAKRELFDNKRIFDILSSAKRTITNINDYRARYSTSDEHNTIKIKFL